MPNATTSSAPSNTVLSIAIPSPLRRCFDYSPDPASDASTLQVGMRVAVPFGRQPSLVGVIVGIHPPNEHTHHTLRPIHQRLDKDHPSLDQEILGLCQWCAQYYHYPLGEVCHLALPTLLRKTAPPPVIAPKPSWQLTEAGQQYQAEDFGRAHKQRSAWEQLIQQPLMSNEALKSLNISRATLTALENKGLVAISTATETIATTSKANQEQPLESLLAQDPLRLTTEQQSALAAIHFDRFNTYLLEGVTGSGKTEVYLQAIAKVIAQGKQALVLVPEIGLTPQTVERFKRRFRVHVSTLHSGISDRQRLQQWRAAKSGEAAIVIGTRSAVFTPLPALGLIIVDEEHDLSYKQQDGVRYSARDTAIVRAQKRGIPIILGSATPSLETLHNALSQRFTHLPLRQRATNANMPIVRCVDNQHQAEGDLSPIIIQAIQRTLDSRQQALLFINRRGYAPTLICQDCHWMSQCNNCDSRMTLHRPTQGRSVLHCHHCDSKAALPKQCPNCHSTRLTPLGQGTQRSEEALSQLFPDTPIIRIDRDSIRRKGELENALEQINRNEPCILVGTQMLAKGHHFANVSLAVILGLDNGFFSSDFRGCERMGQLLTQVAGRAGREQHQGYVYIHTEFPEHPLLQQLIKEGYHALAKQLLAERQLGEMPPYCHLAFIRCHAQQASIAIQFLQQARQLIDQLHPPSLELQTVGPLPATIEKRNNRYYYHLQIKARQRHILHQVLEQLCLSLEQQRAVKGLHWLIDVDPQEN